MMMQEFVDLTDYTPTLDEYEAIDAEYMAQDDTKQKFCATWAENKDASLARCRKAVIVNLYDKIRSHEDLIKRRNEEAITADKTIEALKLKIKSLESELDREQEWKPYKAEKVERFKKDYEKLESDPFTKVLSEEEAKQMIAKECGFDTDQITILYEVRTYEVNRHGQLRKAGEIDAKPLYNATDWNYIRFKVMGRIFEFENDCLNFAD